MTREHPQTALLRAAADDVNALFICDGFNGTHKINTVLEYQKYDWKLYTSAKPDVVDYGFEYLGANTTYLRAKTTYWFDEFELYRGDEDVRVVKRTINGETGDITIEVLK
jgi:hypothetical protein